jgi:hypothetical protein
VTNPARSPCGEIGSSRQPLIPARRALEHDQAHGLAAERQRAYRAVARDGPEHRPMLDRGSVEPGPECSHRAGGFGLSTRDADTGAITLGINLRARDQQLEAPRLPGYVLHLDAAQLGPSQRAGEGKEEQSPVAPADQAVVANGHQPHVFSRQRLGTLGRAAMGVADAAQHVADRGVTRVERMAHLPVGTCDGGDLAAQGGPGIALAEVGQVVADQRRAGRHRRLPAFSQSGF